jgi:hypothetical protein
MQDAGWFIDFVYGSRMTSPFKQVGRMKPAAKPTVSTAGDKAGF